MNTLSIDEASSFVLNNKIANIVFIDTCIILDVIRSPIRLNIANQEVASSIELMRVQKEDVSRVFLVTNETVKEEWKDNCESVSSEIEREVKKINLSYKDVISIYKMLYSSESLNHFSIEQLSIHTHLKSLSEELIDNLHIIKREDHHSVNAMNRIFSNKRPAQKGKQEAKDCQIFEAFLDLSKKLRESSYSGGILFVTSNHNDYGKPNQLPESLGQEFGQINANLINSLSWGLSIINKSNECVDDGRGDSPRL